MPWNGRLVRSWYCCICGDGPMSRFIDACSMCHAYRCESCCWEIVQTKGTEEELEMERGDGGLNTFTLSTNAGPHQRAPEEPQQALRGQPHLTLAAPLDHAEPHSSHLSLPEPHISSLSRPAEPHVSPLSWPAEPHPREVLSQVVSPAESPNNYDSRLSPLVSSSLPSGYDSVTLVPPVDTSDHLSPTLTAPETHLVTTTHWVHDPRRPLQSKPIRFAAAEKPRKTLAGKRRTKRPDRNRPSTQGNESDDQENKTPFACPFWKKNPLQSWSSTRACYSSHKRISHVKYHVFRNHSSQHWADKNKRPKHDLSGGLTDQQYRQLKGYSDRTISREEQWFVIWDIIFPNQPRPVSPYVNDLFGEVDQYFNHTLAQDIDNLSALSLEITAPAQTKEILHDSVTPFGSLPLFNEVASLPQNLAGDVSGMGTLINTPAHTLGSDVESWKSVCQPELALYGDCGSLANYQSNYQSNSIPTNWGQANVLLYNLAPDRSTFPFPYT